MPAYLLPLKPDNAPATLQGYKDATPDLPSGGRVGLACEASGCVVIDVDEHPGSPSGSIELNRLERELGPLDAKLVVTTKQCGAHHYFRAQGGERSGRLGPGLDIKAIGGYVACPPTPGYEIAVGEADERGVPRVDNLTTLPQEWLHYILNRRALPTFEDAVKAYQKTHPLTFTQDGHCPICTHYGCFRRLANSRTKWACFSTNHTVGGQDADGHWWGDVLDIDAHKQSKTRYQILLEQGLLEPKVDKRRKSPRSPEGQGGEVPRLERGDELEVSELIQQEYEGRLVSHGGTLWLYNPERGIWKLVSDKEVIAKIGKYKGAAYGEKGVLKISSAFVKGVADLLIRQTDEKQQEVAGVAFKDRFVTLENGEIVDMDHSPDHYARSGIDEDYLANCGCPKFLQNMTEVFEPDEDGDEKIQVIREFVGLCLMGLATKYNRAMVFIGEGNNGKSVVIETIAGLFPHDALHSLDLHALAKPEDRAQLVGKKLNVVSDIRGNDLMCGDDVKAVFSGEYVSARNLYKSKFQFRPTAGHLFGANKLPASNDNSKGFWRRWLPLAFNRSFDGTGRTKAQVVEENLTERQGIILWALEGAAKVLSQGDYTIPSSMSGTIAEWQQDSDKVRGFVADCCEDSEEHAALKDLYERFVRYCRMTGQKPLAITNFGRRLAACGYKPHKTPQATTFKLSVLPENRWRDVPDM